jgi:hypothetical protein
MHVNPLLPLVIAGDHHIMALRKDGPAKVQECYYRVMSIYFGLEIFQCSAGALGLQPSSLGCQEKIDR